jgi:poly-gamma-glutamate synthesis protein (capsule biosynthesis protein)
LTKHALTCLALARLALAGIAATLAAMPLPARAQERTVTLAIGGDVMLADGPGREVAAGRDPLRHVAAFLRGADLAIANLESPVATVGRPVDKPITFRAHPRVVATVKRHLDAVSLANNHSGDLGPAALVQTMDLLAAGGVPFFGAGRDLAAAHRPLLIERNGLKIALLGFLDFKPRSFEAGASRPGVAWAEDEQVAADIRAARAAGADLVIPFVHWGFDEDPQPTARQRDLGRRMIDAGADLVVGGHPHLAQGLELYKGRLLVHSLGNLVFDGFDPGPGRTGWLLHVTLGRDGTRAWHTAVVNLDGSGVPRPDPQAERPCGDGVSVRTCRGAER